MADLIGQILTGWLLADFLGGILHWVEDVGLLPRFLDRHVGAPNRLHHADPLSVTRDSNLFRRNWTAWAATLPFILVGLVLAGPTPLVVSASAGALLSYEVHRWAHAPSSAPGIVRLLQEIGAFQSPKHHSRHHAPPQDRAFCILTDWLNPILDRSGVWLAAERLRRT